MQARLPAGVALWPYPHTRIRSCEVCWMFIGLKIPVKLHDCTADIGVWCYNDRFDFVDQNDFEDL